MKVGVFDQANLVRSEIDRAVSGTGAFANLTGVLFGHGTSPGGVGFDGPLKGTLCY